MKFQPKRFVVEVKRGTNRAAFASPDPVSDRFSSAEAMLFGAAPKVEARSERPSTAMGDAPGGRILQSLVEPPPPAVEDPLPPVRRGRKPGSKNKPKLQPSASAAPADPDVAAERPRRGRKPGSKNRPKAPVSAAFPSDSSGGRHDAAAAMRSYGFSDDGTIWQEAAEARPPEAAGVAASPSLSAGKDDAATAKVERPRARLRDRSTILRRYVLDLDPRPGQPGASRTRRQARAGR